jgi:hypothetical protein
VPQNVIEQARVEASKTESRPVSYVAAGFMILFWILTVFLTTRFVLDFFKTRT